MSTICIDFGNTHVKLALFEKNELLEEKQVDSLEELYENEFFFLKSNQIILCSVTKQHEAFIAKYKDKLNILVFDNTTSIPLVNKYKTPQTLGTDRLAAAIGAYSLFPNHNVLNIDCGTCIKYNFVNSNGEFMGGAISPGLRVRFKALNSFTDKLPLIPFNSEFQQLIGTDTEESILSGVINGAVAEVDGIITSYNNEFKNLSVVLSGGDSYFFAKRLKNSIFTHPKLVLIGLNYTLLYNLDKK